MAGDSASEWTEALSAFVVRNARAVIVFWIVLVAALNVAIPQLEEVVEHDSTSFIPLDSPAVVGLERMDNQFGDGKSEKLVQVIGQRDGGLTDTDLQYFYDLRPRLEADAENVSFVQDVESDEDVREALTSDDGEALYVTVGIPGATGAPAANSQIDAVREIAHAEVPDGLHVEVTGAATTIRDMTHTIESSLTTITIAILAAIAIIVQFLYRSVGVTILILSVIGIALGVGRALVAFCGLHVFGISTFTGSIVTAVVLAAACDYAVFLISRYHEYRRDGLNPPLAAALAGSRVSGVIIGSALTVAIANAAMLLADIAFFRTTGPAVAVAVVATLALAVTLIPAVLSVAGQRGMMEPRPLKAGGGFWARMADLVVAHPTRVLMAGLVPLGLFAAFYPTMNVSYDERSNQPEETESNRGFALLADHFPVNEATPSFVVITSQHDLRTAESLAAIERASDSVARIDGIKSVRSITRPDGDTISEASVGYQAGEVGEKLDEAAVDIEDGAADAQKLADGADELDEGAGELHDGADQLDSGAEKLADGSWQAVDGAERLLDGADGLTQGLKRLRDGAGDAQAGSAALRAGAAELAEQLSAGADQAQAAVDGLGMAYDALAHQSLTCGVDPACQAARDGIKQIYEAERDQLVPGMRQAARGARQIAQGSASLDAGLGELEDGLTQARTGAAKIERGQRIMAAKLQEMADGADQLEDGTSQLRDGTDELTDGTEKVADGTQEAADAIDELRDGLEEASEYLLELGDNAGDPSIGGFYLPEDAFEEDDLVSAVDLYLSSDHTTARLFVLDEVDAQEREAALRIEEVEDATRRALAGTDLADAEIYITGSAAFNENLHDLSQQDFRLVASVALVAVLLILMFMLRSLVAPLFLVASVVLSYAAAMGLSVLIWQDLMGHDLDWTVPSIAFVMLVAVGADYNLLLMKRIQEEAADGSRVGIGRALALTGGVITAAGIIFAASMFAMMTAEAVGLAQTGFTIGMGLLIDTFIVRTFIVPSVSALLGPSVWWPRQPESVVPMDELLRQRDYATSS